MSSIRKQSIISSLFIYVGFVFGAVNTYLFAKEGYFSPEEYGLVQLFIAINLVFFSFANLGSTAIISRFFPYYYDELEDRKNDLLSLAMVLALTGFVLVCIGSIVFEPLMARKFSAKSGLFVQYYFWILPYTLFYTVFMVLEAHSTINKKPVFPVFLRETGFRIILTVLIILYMTKTISLDTFIKLFSCEYILLTILLAVYLIRNRKLHFTFQVSTVTKNKMKQMLALVAFVYGGNIIFNIAQNIDVITISSQQMLAYAGIFTFSNYIASIITVPQRSMVAVVTPYLSQAWKDNNYTELQRLYSRSAINLLIISLLLFGLIWLNMDAAYTLLKIDPAFQEGKMVVLILGIKFIIDMGTGVNSQLLYTSPSWRFEFLSGVVLLVFSIILNYYLVRAYGITGAAIAGFISLFVYNLIRLVFIWKKYKMHPLSWHSLGAVVSAIACYFIVHLILQKTDGWPGVIIKSICFGLLFTTCVWYFKLTPDIQHLINAAKRRLGIKDN
jgi:O-antigen/teichoic acid export membrane protein